MQSCINFQELSDCILPLALAVGDSKPCDNKWTLKSILEVRFVNFDYFRYVLLNPKMLHFFRPISSWFFRCHLAFYHYNVHILYIVIYKRLKIQTLQINITGTFWVLKMFSWRSLKQMVYKQMQVLFL